MSDPLPIRARPPLVASVALLAAHGLAVEDLTESHLEHFFFAGPAAAPAGLAGLELYGTDALLRSVVVAGAKRRFGLGTALVARAEAHAAELAVGTLYLLTTTAQSFFARQGYVLIERTQVPLAIQGTREFMSLCPASAALMVKTLGDP